MEIEIYADMVFLVNWCMDFLILWVVGKITRKRAPFLRVVLAAFVMSFLYCAIVFIAVLHIYYNIFASLLLIMLGAFIAFKPHKLKEFLVSVLLSYATSFTLGGMGMALFYFMNINILDITGQALQNFSFKLLLASTAVFYLLIKLASRWIEKLTVKRQTFMPVKVFYDDRLVTLNALVDTGNSLHDPISGVPVIVAEFCMVKDFLPEKLRLMFYENREDSLDDIVSHVQGGFSRRMRMIPYASLGKRNGMLLGFRPDKVEITREKDVLVIHDVIVGIYNNKLSGDDAYQCLLNPALISGGETRAPVETRCAAI